METATKERGRRMRMFSIAVWGIFTYFGISSVFAQQQLLDSILQRIDRYNPTLRSLQYTVVAKDWRVAISGKLPDPTLQGRWAAQPIETRNGPQQFGIRLGQRFPWFGVLAGREQAARAQAQAQQLHYQDVRLQLHRQAKTYFAQLYLLQWQQQFTREHIQILQMIRDLLVTRIQVGQENTGNLFRLDNEVALLAQRLRSLQRKRVEVLAQLFALFDADPDTAFRIQQLPLVLHLASWDSLLAVAKRHNPALARFQKLAQAADFLAASAEAQGYPTVGVGVEYVGIGAGTLTTERAGQDALMLGLQLSLPLDRYRYDALVQEQQAYRQQFVWQYRMAERQLQAHIIQLLQQFEDRKDQWQVVRQTLIPNTRRALDLLLEEYATGRVDIEIVLNTQRELLRYSEQEKILETQLFNLLAQRDFLLGITR